VQHHLPLLLELRVAVEQRLRLTRVAGIFRCRAGSIRCRGPNQGRLDAAVLVRMNLQRVAQPAAGVGESTFWQKLLPKAPRIRLPKPEPSGGNTEGPPRSCQTKVNTHDVQSSRTLTRPCGTDSAPYLSALVSSSCRIRERFCVICGPSTRRGFPLISNRDSKPRISLLMRSLRRTPSPIESVIARLVADMDCSRSIRRCLTADSRTMPSPGRLKRMTAWITVNRF
jgi:hypothetical protein